MAYYNERRTVESMVFPLALIAIVKDGIPDKFESEKAELIKLFEEAGEEALPKTMTDKQATSLYNRISDVIRECIAAPAREANYQTAKAALVVYYFMKNMIDQGLYAIVEGSKMDAAMDKFLPAVEPWLEEERFDRSAFKESRRMLKRMHEHGYFKDVQWHLTFE